MFNASRRENFSSLEISPCFRLREKCQRVSTVRGGHLVSGHRVITFSLHLGVDHG